MVPVLEAEPIAAFGQRVVALTAPEAAAGLQMRVFIRSFEAAGLALGAPLVGILAGGRAVHNLSGCRPADAQEQGYQ